MPLKKEYQWLAAEGGPKMLVEALKLIDVIESPGTANNPVIISWAAEIGANVASVYKSDEIPWCGLFIAVIAKRAGKEVVKDPLWALNWGTFGTHTETPMLGDILVFTRTTADGKKAGHVAMYVGEDSKCYHILGGNQSDRVCIVRKDKSQLYIARRTPYNVQPANVRQIILPESGELSGKEF
ncbi:MAG: TIGR02594 family protein [Bacteroidetes bacterium]|nr:TIGR02594 family protein [Bacteroidota bacterium]